MYFLCTCGCPADRSKCPRRHFFAYPWLSKTSDREVQKIWVWSRCHRDEKL